MDNYDLALAQKLDLEDHLTESLQSWIDHTQKNKEENHD